MRLLVLALAAPLALIGAAYPDKADLPPAAPTADNPISGPVTYRPCRPGRGDDRCIQLYERGVRDSLASWNSSSGAATSETATGGPFQAADQNSAGKPAAATSSTTTTQTGTTGTSTATETGGTSGTSHAGHDMSGSAETKPPADPTGTTQDDTTKPDM